MFVFRSEYIFFRFTKAHANFLLKSSGFVTLGAWYIESSFFHIRTWYRCTIINLQTWISLFTLHRILCTLGWPDFSRRSRSSYSLHEQDKKEKHWDFWLHLNDFSHADLIQRKHSINTTHPSDKSVALHR